MHINRLRELAGLQIILEANILNAKSPIVINLPTPPLHGDMTGAKSIIFPDLKWILNGVGDYTHALPHVKDWLLTIFYKWALKTGMEYQSQLHRDRVHQLENMKMSRENLIDFLKNNQIDKSWIDQNIDTIWKNLPNWSKSSDGLIIGGWTIYYSPELQSSETAKLDTIGSFVYSFPFMELIDFLNTRQDIGNMSVPDAMRLSWEWHNSPSQKTYQEKKRVDSIEQDEDYKIIYNYDNGYRFVQLLTPLALDHETFYLNHCIGKGGYDDALKEKNSRFISLWDSDNIPKGTFELRKAKGDWNIIQLQGHDNGRIEDDVQKYFKDFIVRAHLKYSHGPLKNLDHEYPISW